ncbi:MAG: hypothetical protein NZO16_02230 [Deltaproteobacteria bacterium]|nr:hypothetical protein [Deltaproteobacteria bacterium]
MLKVSQVGKDQCNLEEIIIFEPPYSDVGRAVNEVFLKLSSLTVSDQLSRNTPICSVELTYESNGRKNNLADKCKPMPQDGQNKTACSSESQPQPEGCNSTNSNTQEEKDNTRFFVDFVPETERLTVSIEDRLGRRPLLDIMTVRDIKQCKIPDWRDLNRLTKHLQELRNNISSQAKKAQSSFPNNVEESKSAPQKATKLIQVDLDSILAALETIGNYVDYIVRRANRI